MIEKAPWAASVVLHLVVAVELGLFGAWLPEPRPVEPGMNPEAWRARPPCPPPNFVDTPRPDLPSVWLPRNEPHFRPEAVESGLNETADHEEFQNPKGSSLDFSSRAPFHLKVAGDRIGIGAGGGRYGTRLGALREVAARGRADPDDPVLAALRWLARHQSADGSWSVTGYVGRCREACLPNPGSPEFDTGITGLALLAFLGARYSHLSKDEFDGIRFGTVVMRALQWILGRQDAEGCVGPRNSQKYMLNHLLGALALTEAYGLTGSGLFQEPAQRAVDFTIAAQNPGGGWRYGARCGDEDSIVTGWATMVLKSAEISSLAFPRSSYDGAIAWFDEVTDPATGRASYARPAT